MPRKKIADIADVIKHLEQITEELLATFKGRKRFYDEQEFIHAGESLHRRLRLCINDLKELEKKGYKS